MVTQEDVELAYQEAMMNMARLNRTGIGAGGLISGRDRLDGKHFRLCGPHTVLAALPPVPWHQFVKHVKTNQKNPHSWLEKQARGQIQPVRENLFYWCLAWGP